MRSYIAKPFSIETSSELCAIISTSHSRANLFSNAAIPYQRKWRNSEVAKFIVGQTCIATNQGRLVGFGIVQGHMAAFLADDIKSNLFQLSHQFSCTRSGRRLARSDACRCPGGVGRAPRSLR